MASFNRVILMGNLTRDVEVKYLPSKTAVADVGLAVNERRKNQAGEWVDDVTFVDLVFWGRTAEIAGEYLSKGSPILVEGRLRLDTWEKDGQKRSKLRVVAERMQMLGKSSDGSRGNANHYHADLGSSAEHAPDDHHDFQGSHASASAPGASDDDIPF